jgi:hypothetical protein
MALRGNLKDFSLPDVFSLVQLSKKTGVLRIVGPDSEGTIWFREGEVFFAQSNWRREFLGDRLVQAQRITPNALERALQIHSSPSAGDRRLGEILVDEGYITQHVLETFVQEQILDTIFDLMRWEEGDFDFEELPAIELEDIGLSVSVENIVMEGSRRLEEWTRIKKKVPSMSMYFKMATAPGEGTFEISLKPAEWNLLLLVDGTKSVSDLAVATKHTDFEVARVIYGLFSAGLLEVPTDEEVERLKAELARRHDKRAEIDATRQARDAAQQAEALDIESRLAAEAAARHGVSVPAEEPAFLSEGAEAPSSDDLAMFEQMMSAVLAPAGDEQAPSAPIIVDEPATPFDEVPGMPMATSAPESEDYGYGGAISAADLAEIPAPPVAEAYGLPVDFVPSGDYETDLRSLGLGELPVELQAPAAELELAPAAPATEESAAWADEMPAAEEPELVDDSDLDSLLASLGGEPVAPTGVISSGVDYGAEEPGASGYISTDAFLAEFDSGGLSAGLGDELTALTGGGSGGRGRPKTTVAPLPEQGEGIVLKRDHMVDKALLQKIIDGIENL